MLSHTYCQSVYTLSQTSVKPKASELSAISKIASAIATAMHLTSP